MDRRQFLKFLAQSSASVGATVFVEKVWGFPTIALLSRNNNKLFHWGVGSTGFAGTTGVNVLQPAKILPRHNFLSIQTNGISNQFVAVGITKKGDILTWGYNDKSSQGPIQGTVASPVLFGTTSTWSQVNVSPTHSAGIRPPGTLWTWGDNASGQLGNGGPIGGITNTPVQVTGISDWTAVQTGISATFAMRTDGTLWSCGANNGGYLGNGQTSGQTVAPTQVGGNSYSAFAAGKTHVLAVTTGSSKELWSWGQNIDGQLGLGDVAARLNPVKVGTMTNWSKVFAANGISFAIKTDGTLWAWGYNASGELGLGDRVNRSSPTQVGGTDWLTVSASLEHTLAIKTDGTLWGWGTNDRGQLSSALPSSISSPVQIGSGTSWVSIATVGGILGSASFGIRTK